ncbi:hypothetical protein [Streptomyces sp. NPDC058545]|uniref:hypothetical protein n=1 Tax=Streptomyces sp. NPDC058545 TaxID=3346544 RepID=UPI0036461DB5
MTVLPFIEAEKTSGHNVKRACELLKVSRAAFYARRTGTPRPRAVRDAEVEELRKERDQALAAVRRCEADLAAQRNVTQRLMADNTRLLDSVGQGS